MAIKTRAKKAAAPDEELIPEVLIDPETGEPLSVEAAAEGGAEDEEAAAEPEVSGPRIKFENGPFHPVKDGEQRERRLLIAGHNYEHVSDVEDQGETIWVYRRM